MTAPAPMPNKASMPGAGTGTPPEELAPEDEPPDEEPPEDEPPDEEPPEDEPLEDEPEPPEEVEEPETIGCCGET